MVQDHLVYYHILDYEEQIKIDGNIYMIHKGNLGGLDISEIYWHQNFLNRVMNKVLEDCKVNLVV